LQGNQRFTQIALSKLRELRRLKSQNFNTFDNQPARGFSAMVTKFASRAVVIARPGAPIPSLQAPAAAREIVTRFGEPTNEYQGVENLPEELRQDIPLSNLDDATFCYFGMEGLPSYWSFVVAKSSTGIDWGIVRSRP
jgi:hypothetical protein